MASSIQVRKGKRTEPQFNSKRAVPLLRDVELPFVGTYHPLGFTVEIATNSKDVLLAAEESWQHFRQRLPQPRIQFRLGVLEGNSGDCPPPPSVRSHRDLVTRIVDADNFVASNEHFAFGSLTQAAVAHRPYLRYFFIEGTFWTIVDPRYLTSIHAACVSYQGRGVLLCGDSGAGKSSLAYACARSGWSFLCDDCSNIVRSREGRIVIGDPYRIRFRSSAMDLFPELRYQRVNAHITGKLCIELVTETFPQIERALEAHVDFIVFLRRQPGPARLTRLSKESVQGWFERVISVDPPMRDLQRAELADLLTAEIFQLRYSDFDAAIARLEALAQSGAAPYAETVLPIGSQSNV